MHNNEPILHFCLEQYLPNFQYSFRTSHYPYAEEIMDLADKFGIVIVDESPGVALDGFHNKQLLKNHLRVMEELVDRDKNRASVLVWSVANEPRSQHDGADTYFSTVATHTKVRPYLCNITTTIF